MERLVRERICDRCHREFDVRVVKGETMETTDKVVPVFSASFVREGKATQNVEFTDLCKKCESRIGSLLASIKMDKAGKSSK